jgi:demethylmenaquinone methyltransferase/2-methoxy-6-polyprenyl-1,4-benzoquinol methylase
LYSKKKPETIRTMFDNIASNYDRTNAVLSFCMHHLWNRALVKNVVAPCKPHSLVDLCAGTGEIAFRSMRAVPALEKLQLVDFSAQMLECAKHKEPECKNSRVSVSYVQANVEELPLEDSSVDCATMAYGIRNVSNPLKCLKDVYRILKPNGALGILELTEPSNKVLKAGHRFYLKNLLPHIGKWLTYDKEAYTYLCNSIHHFVKPEALKQQMQEAGFSNLHIRPLAFGIATLFIAKKNV